MLSGQRQIFFRLIKIFFTAATVPDLSVAAASRDTTSLNVDQISTAAATTAATTVECCFATAAATADEWDGRELQ